MLIATLRWRDEFDVDAALKEEYPEDIFGNLGHIYGHDKGGRPVVYVLRCHLMSRHFFWSETSYNIYGGNNDLKVVFGDVRRFIRWISRLYSYLPLIFRRWRVALMEKSVQLLDFQTTDQTIQVHGGCCRVIRWCCILLLEQQTDYEGVSLSSRDANSKNATAEATNIFQNHYPELLVRHVMPTDFFTWHNYSVQEVLCERPVLFSVDILDRETSSFGQYGCQNVRSRTGVTRNREGGIAIHWCEGVASTIWRRGKGFLIYSSPSTSAGHVYFTHRLIRVVMQYGLDCLKWWNKQQV